MNINDWSIDAAVALCSGVVCWWLKACVEGFARHNYDIRLEGHRSALKRDDVLMAERLAVFKTLSADLLALRRYCDARSAEFRSQSEFESRADSLTEQENISLLSHHEKLNRSLGGSEFFISPECRQHFESLLGKMGHFTDYCG